MKFREMSKRDKLANYLTSLIFWTILAVIFYRSFIWPENVMNGRRKLSVIASIFMVVVVPIVIVFLPSLNKRITEFRANFVKTIRSLPGNGKKIGKIAIVYVMGICIGVIFSVLVAKIGWGQPYEAYQGFFFAIVGAFVSTIVIFRKKVIEYTALFVFLIIMLMGSLLIHVSPVTTGLMLDDQDHYLRATKLSYLLNGYTFTADYSTIRSSFADTEFTAKGWYNEEERLAYKNLLNEKFESKELIGGNFNEIKAIWIVSYIPFALASMLGRGLGFSVVTIFYLQKYFMLLLYALLMYYAVKKLRYGKSLLAVFAILPTPIYAAASFSYDAWVIGFITCGYACLFGAIQSDEKISLKELVKIVVLIVIGVMPKAVYFVMLLPVLLIPKEKFASQKIGKIFRIIAMTGGILLLCSIAVPILLRGFGTGDVRGGEEVNSSLQVQYVLAHPFAFAKLVLENLRWYFLDTYDSTINQFGWLGNGYMTELIVGCCFATAIADTPSKKISKTMRVTVLLMAVLSMVLVIAAMYVSFTPVGLGQVNGVQGRYLLPIVFPTLAMIGFSHIDSEKVNGAVRILLPVCLVSFTYFYNVYDFIVQRYLLYR